MGGMSYNSKNQSYQLIFLAQLRAPEHLPLLFPSPVLLIAVIHSYSLIHSFILIFSKYWRLAYCMLMTADTMINITPVSFTEDFTSPGKLSKRTGRGLLECIFLKSESTDASYFTGWMMMGKNIRTQTMKAQKEGYNIPAGKPLKQYKSQTFRGEAVYSLQQGWKG